MNPDEVRLAAGVVGGLTIISYILALIAINRRHRAKLDRLRADYEASVAPHYAALIRSGKTKQGDVRTDARLNTTTTESDTP